MTVETTVPARTAYDDWLDRRWRLTGAVLGLLAVVTASLMVTLGLRPATYGDLLADVASGKVAEVRVIGPDAPSEGDTVELRWSSLGGVLDQYVVVQVAGSSGYDISGERLFATQVDPRDILRGISPSVQLTEASSVDDPPVTFMGWGVPGQVALLGVATWLGVLLLVVGGPSRGAPPAGPGAGHGCSADRSAAWLTCCSVAPPGSSVRATGTAVSPAAGRSCSWESCSPAGARPAAGDGRSGRTPRFRGVVRRRLASRPPLGPSDRRERTCPTPPVGCAT